MQVARPTRRERTVLSLLLGAAVVIFAAAVAGGWMSGAPAGTVHWVSVIPELVAVTFFVARGIGTPGQRHIWFAVALGIASYAGGTLYWNLWLDELDPAPYPSVADALWLAFYPATYYALGSLVRIRLPRLTRALVLDGLVAALGLVALAAAILGPAVARNSEGLEPFAQVTTFAYPAADLVLLALVGFVFVVTGWRPGRGWSHLGIALVSVTLADMLWSNQVAGMVGGSPGISNLLWFLAFGLVALAAWQPVADLTAAPDQSRFTTAIPLVFAGVAMSLLLLDHFHELNTLALVVATIAALLALVRTALAAAEERALAESRRQAMTDELTGLPNRRAFLGRLAEAIEVARDQDDSVGLLMIDLDRFKELNDTLGHAAGDEMLASLGPRLEGALGRQGRLARLGGDEFGVILPRASEAKAEAIAEMLRASIELPFDLRGLRITVGASVGVAIFPLHAGSGEELLQHADVAMYQAKHGGGGVEAYAAERDEHSRDRLVLAADLRHAITEDRLSVVYQPKAAARSGEVASVEALVRWQHFSHGPIPPDQFVPLAEQTGLGGPLTRRVLEHAVRQAARWNADGRPLRVAVNLCAADLADAAFPEEVAALLGRHRLPPGLLQVEVTENTVLADPGRADAVLARLNEIGVTSSLDDFGTGHSSLTHLRRLPVREIKLDRSFVAGMLSDSQDASIVRSTVELAARLGLRVVAEGVEDETTWGLLRDLGCDEIQGYLLSPPLPPADLSDWLTDRDGLRQGLPLVQAVAVPGR
jgi:diguanylate cyclase (GGDEF)-like protein